MASRTQSNSTTDHETIRNWAEERNARPACVRGTGGEGDAGMIRLDFPGYSGEESLEEITWDEWFGKFDESGLALLYQDTTAGGEKSNFNKLISRDAAEGRTPRRQRKRMQTQAGQQKRTVGRRGARKGAATARRTRTRRATAGTSRATRAKRAASSGRVTAVSRRTGAKATARGRRSAAQAKTASPKMVRGRTRTAAVSRAGRKGTVRAMSSRGASAGATNMRKSQAKKAPAKQSAKILSIQARGHKTPRSKGNRAA